MKNKISFAMIFASFGMFAATMNITENVVVTEKNVADYVSADINIAEGVELKFENLEQPRTLSGKITGSGNLVIKNKSVTSIRMTLAGDATEFTGIFAITNHPFTVASPAAIGDAAKIFAHVPQGSQYNLFYNYFDTKDAIYKNEFHFKVGGNAGVRLENGVSLTGPVYWYGGRLNGKTTAAKSYVKGPLTLMPNAFIYCQGAVALAGGVSAREPLSTSTPFIMDGSALFIESDIDSSITTMQIIGKTLSIQKENPLPDGVSLLLGDSWKKYATIELNGYNVRCRGLKAKDLDEAQMVNTYIVSPASRPATFEIVDAVDDINYPGLLNGAVSLVYSSEGNKRFRYAGVNSTTTGSITIKSGTFACAPNASAPSLSAISLQGSGVLEVEKGDAQDSSMMLLLKASGCVFNVTDEGKISIPEGIIVDVPRMTHDGSPVMCGDYRAGDESAIAEHIVGGGILRVVNNESVVVSSSFTWVGGNEDTAITSPANWQGGIAPTFDGTEHLIFSSGTKAVVSGAIKAYSIKVAMPSDFRIEAANENAKIVLGQGGLSLNNENDAPMATCEVACPIELDYLPQTWVVVSNTVLKNLSPISGRPSQNGLVIDSRGRVEFHADNSELYTPLEIRITNRKVSQPRVYNYKGLGSKTRPATIYGAPFIFVIPGNGHYTNEVPLRIFNQCTTPDPNNVYNGIFINDSNQGHLYLKGKVTYYNAYCETYFKGNVHFLGGVTHESGKRIVWRMAGANEWIEGEGFHSEGELEIDYTGNLNIVAPCTYSMINPYKATIVCYASNVLDPAGAFVFGNENKNMLSSSSQLNMNGYDQKVSRIYRRWADEADASNYVTLNSPSTGAVLTIENKEAFNDRLPMRVLNGAGLAFNAAGSLELVQNNTPFVSTTTGRLAVARGTLRFGAGVSWPNVSSIELTGGALVLSETTASLAFGPAAGKSSARMIRDGGTLEIPAGETACVYSCSWHNEKGNMRHLDPGVYGGSEAGLSTKYTLDWITGGGMLKVLCSEAPGTVIIVR